MNSTTQVLNQTQIGLRSVRCEIRAMRAIGSIAVTGSVGETRTREKRGKRANGTGGENLYQLEVMDTHGDPRQLFQHCIPPV